jgi:O-antigen/teichoic acid export membrane protein
LFGLKDVSTPIAAPPRPPSSAAGKQSSTVTIEKDCPDVITTEIVGASGAERHAEHLSTVDLREQIKSRTVSGGVVSAAAQGGQLALTLAYNAVLARLLSPREFGLVAMAMTIGGFLQIFKDAGLSTATIQREDITHAQVSNLFWINLGVSCVAGMTMVITAPLIAWFFHQSEVAGISVTFAFGFLFEGLAVQHMALLNRQMRFKLASGIEVGAAAAGFLIGIVMALSGWGYWSLVGATLSTSLMRLMAVWMAVPWRPKRPTRQSGTGPLVHFGADLTLVGILYAFARGSDGLLIGRFLGTEAVGLYSRATALLTRPMERLISPIHQVIVPALSRLQAEPERYKQTFLSAFGGLVIAFFLFTAVFFPLAHPLVIVVLGQKWEAAAPIFAALTIAALFYPFCTATSWLYTSQGRGRALLLNACSTAVILVSSFALGVPFGPIGVATGYSVSGIFIQLPVTFYIVGRQGPVTTKDLWSAFIRHLPVFLVVLTVTWLIASFSMTSSPLQQLIVSALSGLVGGAAAIFLFPPSRHTAMRLLGMLKGLRDQRK